MLAVLLIAALVATVSAQHPLPEGEPHKDVKIIPHAKAVVHEEAQHVHRGVHLIQQVPVVQHHVQTIVNEVPRIIRKPKIIRKTRVHRKFYPVDVPHIRKITEVKPVPLVKKVPVPRPVVVHVPEHIVKTQKVDVPIDMPIKKIEERKVVRYQENKIFRPRPVVQEKVRVVHVPEPFPVDQVVVKKNPRPRLIVERKPVPIIRNIHTHKKQAVAVPRVKTVAVEVPRIVKQKIPYPVGKGGYGYGHGAPGFNQGGGVVAGSVQVGGGIAGGGAAAEVLGGEAIGGEAVAVGGGGIDIVEEHGGIGVEEFGGGGVGVGVGGGVAGIGGVDGGFVAGGGYPLPAPGPIGPVGPALGKGRVQYK